MTATTHHHVMTAIEIGLIPIRQPLERHPTRLVGCVDAINGCGQCTVGLAVDKRAEAPASCPLCGAIVMPSPGRPNCTHGCRMWRYECGTVMGICIRSGDGDEYVTSVVIGSKCHGPDDAI